MWVLRNVIVALVAFAGAAYATLAVLVAMELRPEARARRRLRQLAREAVAEPAAAAEPERPAGPGLLASLRERLVSLAERRPARGPSGPRLDATTRRLRRAGLRLRAGEFLALQLVSAAAGTVMGAVLRWPAAAIAGAALGWWLPSAYVERRIQARQRAFTLLLPDALTLIANSLRSGYSFLQAADVVARELPEPVASEFGQVVRETRVNIALEDALANLLERVGGRDLDLAVTAVLVQTQVGGNLAEVLDTIAETIRDRMRIEGQVRTLSAQGRMSGWIIGLLPVGLAAVLGMMNPDYMLLLVRHPLGWAMLAFAVISELAGVLVIRQILQVEV